MPFCIVWCSIYFSENLCNYFLQVGMVKVCILANTLATPWTTSKTQVSFCYAKSYLAKCIGVDALSKANLCVLGSIHTSRLMVKKLSYSILITYCHLILFIIQQFKVTFLMKRTNELCPCVKWILSFGRITPNIPMRGHRYLFAFKKRPAFLESYFLQMWLDFGSFPWISSFQNTPLWISILFKHWVGWIKVPSWYSCRGITVSKKVAFVCEREISRQLRRQNFLIQILARCTKLDLILLCSA